MPANSSNASGISLGYFTHPPFTDELHGTPAGVFWNFVNEALSKCHPTPTDNYINKYGNEEDLLQNAIHTHNVSFPVTENFLFNNDPDYTFIPLLTSPGAVWLYSDINGHQGSNLPQLRVIIQAWPLLVIILFSCAFAGIFVWLLERMKNPQEFPQPFIRGFWEGCWWAFVSMTTVGYGDRSPKSILGRTFAFIWISFGLVVISMFTACITTALSQGNQPPDRINFFLYNITVLNGSYERLLVYELGGKAITAGNLAGIIEDLTAPSGSISINTSADASVSHNGVILEHYMYMHIRNEHSDSLGDLLPKYVIQKPSRRGFLTNFKGETLLCLKRYFQRQHFSIYDKVVLHSHEDLDDSITRRYTPEQIAKNFFLTNNIHLLIIFSLFVVLFVILFIWEKCWWKPRNRDYKYVAQNWKSDRQKKESELQRTVDSRNIYKRKKSYSVVNSTTHTSLCTVTPTTPNALRSLPFIDAPEFDIKEETTAAVTREDNLELPFPNGIPKRTMNI